MRYISVNVLCVSPRDFFSGWKLDTLVTRAYKPWRILYSKGDTGRGHSLHFGVFVEP